MLVYITAFASVWSNRNRGSFDSEELLWKILFRLESHVFEYEEFESKCRLFKFPRLKPICFNIWSMQFLELWNCLEPFRMPKVFENPLWNVGGGGDILLVCVHSPHTGKCATALQVIISFLFFFFLFQKCYFTTWFGTDLFIVAERSKDITQVNFSKVYWRKFRTFVNVNVNGLLFTCEFNDTRHLHAA